MHLSPLIRDLAVILGVAGLISLLFRRIRQPVVLGYIVAGILIGPHTPPFQLVTDTAGIETWAELGVVFLMFTLGLEFSFRKLARVGGSAIMTAGMEVGFFVPFGYLLGRYAFGWSPMDGLYLGSMLAISSTTIIIKALDELKLKQHKFAELIFAALIVEDLLAILLLVALGTVAATQAFSPMILLMAALKLILVAGGWFITGYFVLPRFMTYVGRIGSDEMLTVLSLGLCLALVVFATHFHYSTALGAFVMGSILAESPVLPRIEDNMASLRDVFGAIFFVSIGMLIDPKMLWEHKGVIAILCAVTIAGKIFSTGLGALLSGQSLTNSLRVGFGLAQIGEFSFIIAQLGVSLKATSAFLYPVAVAVSVVTTFTTPYLIRLSEPAALAIERALPLRWRDALNRFAAQAEIKRSTPNGDGASLNALLRWTINGLTTSVIFVLVSEMLLPLIQTRFTAPDVSSLLAWSAALVASSPFVWAMLTATRSRQKNPKRRIPPFELRALLFILTLVWVGILSVQLFPGKHLAWIALAILAVALPFMYGRLDRSYQWFERNFLSTFESKAPDQEDVPFSHLAPWDAHVVRMTIHPNSPIVMKTLADAALRVRYGVNIVAIRRGRKTIVTPLPTDTLLPGDELTLLATDAQIDRLRAEFEESDGERAVPESEYELRQGRLSRGSRFINQSIRQTGFREKHHAMVVGIERGGERIVNPDSDLELREGDLLWIAGERTVLDRLMPTLS